MLECMCKTLNSETLMTAPEIIVLWNNDMLHSRTFHARNLNKHEALNGPKDSGHLTIPLTHKRKQIHDPSACTDSPTNSHLDKYVLDPKVSIWQHHFEFLLSHLNFVQEG
jgi:hypothetical protein